MTLKFSFLFLTLLWVIILEAQPIAKITFHKKERFNTSHLANSPFAPIPFIESIVELYFDSTKGYIVEKPDFSNPEMQLIKTYCKDSSSSYYDFEKKQKLEATYDFDGQALAIEKAFPVFSSKFARKTKTILGYPCKALKIELPNRIIQAWVTKSIKLPISFDLFLGDMGAILAWTDNLGNSSEAIALEWLDEKFQIPVLSLENHLLISQDSIVQLIDSDKIELGKKAAYFAVQDLKGESWNSEKLLGKVIVFNFWFVACTPCRAEIPAPNEFVKKYPEVVFFAPSLDNLARIELFAQKVKFDYTLIPNCQEFATKWGINAYPTHIIIDKKGIIRFQNAGAELHQLESMLLKCLAE